MNEDVRRAIQPDGGLYNLGWYLSWTPKYPTIATLDGEFTADELRSIAEYMEANTPK